MKTAKILSFTTLVAMAMGACSVSLAEEVKGSSTSTEIVSVEGSDLRNEEALRVAVGDFDDVEFLLSAEEVEAIADNVYISLNGVSAKGDEGSGSSMFFSGEASGQVEATQSASTTFNGALILASKTTTSDAVTTGVGAVAMSMSSDKSTEQYATDAGKSYYEQVSISNSGSAVTTYSATSFLGNSNSVGDGNGGYGTSAIDSGIVPFAARTWRGDGEENKWGGSGNWNGNTWSNGDNATFNATGGENTTVTVDGTISAGTITVTGNTNYTFNYESGASLTATGNVIICNSNDDNSSLTITGGTNEFSGTNVYVAYKQGSTGSLKITGGTNEFSGTYVYVGYGNEGTGTLTITGGENTFDAKVRLGGADNSGTRGTAEVTISGGTTTFTDEVDVGYSGNCTMTISGDNTVVTFKGKVVVDLKESSDYTDTLTITGGTTIFEGDIEIGKSSSGGAGYMTITGGTTIFEGAIEIGNSTSTNSTGTLTITGGTTTIKGATTIENNNCSLSVSGGTVYLETEIGTSAKGTVTISGDANIVLSGELLASIEALANGGVDGAVAVITANTITFGNVELTLDSTNANSSNDLDSVINKYISAEGYTLTWSWDGSTLWVINAVAPEPSMFGLFFGLGAIGLVATRRRRRS